MKKLLIYVIICLMPFIPGVQAHFVCAGQVVESAKEKEQNRLDEENYKKFEASRKLLCEKLARRTKEYSDLLDGLFFTLNSHARKAIEAKDFRTEKELIIVLSDYNSVLGDLGLMQVILGLSQFISEDKFMEYYELMERGFERLKDSFSLKNELFLSRIDKIKDQEASRYEKKLLKYYKDYFEYDLRLDRIEDDKSEQK